MRSEAQGETRRCMHVCLYRYSRLRQWPSTSLYFPAPVTAQTHHAPNWRAADVAGSVKARSPILRRSTQSEVPYRSGHTCAPQQQLLALC